MDQSFISQISKLLVRAVYVFYSLFLAFIVLALVLSFVLDYRMRMSALNIGDFETFPTPNDPSVPLTTSVSIEYSEPISPTTVNSRTFVVQAMQSGQVLATYGVHGGKIVLTPTIPFRPGELVLASATTGTLGAMSGNGPLTPTVWQFNAAAPAGPGEFIQDHNNLGTNTTAKLIVGDVDRDGDLDVVLGNENAVSEVWLNEPDPETGLLGSFVLAQSLGSYATWDVDLGDLDGDGDLDIFLANVGQPNAVWINLGGMQGGQTGVFTDSLQALGIDSTTGAALGDFDGDGDLDVATNRWNGLAGEFFINSGGAQGGMPGFFIQSSQLFPTNNGRDITAGDVDNDGDLDIITAVWNRPDIIWLNNGDGTFVNSGQPLGSSFANTLALGDVDHDDDLDVYVGTGNLQMNMLWLNQGGLQGGTIGTFAASTSVLTNTGSFQVAMGDLNGDGSLDLIGSGHRVWFNDGTGFFSFENSAPFSDGEVVWALAPGDVNNDDDLDLIIGYNFELGQNAVWRNNSAPQIQALQPPGPIGEGTAITLGVTINSTDSPEELLTLNVEWGDGLTDTYQFPAANNLLALNHTYVNNRPDDEPYPVQLMLSDPEGGQDSATTTVEVSNIPPSLEKWNVTNKVNEGGTAMLNGEMFDPGADTLVLSLNWGEGMQEVHHFPAGTTTFSLSHTYLDDNPTGTPVDPYTIDMILVDEDLALDQGQAFLTVHNVDPEVNAGPDQLVTLGTPVQFEGSFTDPGSEDTHEIWWEMGEGTIISGTLTPSHTYTSSGTYTVTFFVLDDDTGLASDILLITMKEPDSNNHPIYMPVIIHKP